MTERETVLARLGSVHRATANTLGFSGMPFVAAEQIDGNLVARVDTPDTVPIPGADGLIIGRPELVPCDLCGRCAAVYLADRQLARSACRTRAERALSSE